jgi:hypothetical protein
MVGRAQEQAQTTAGQAQDKVRDQVGQRSSQLGAQLNQQASDLRSVSEALRDQGKDRPAKAVDHVAGYAEQAGGYLHDRDADTLLNDAENLGREKPGTVALGALAIGFLASRFLKASSERRYASREVQQAPAHSTAVPAPASGEQSAAAGPPPVNPAPVSPVLPGR